jgi:YD repeat-containing protein
LANVKEYDDIVEKRVKEAFAGADPFTGDVMLGNMQFPMTDRIQEIVDMGDTVLPFLRQLAEGGTPNEKTWAVICIGEISTSDYNFLKQLHDSDSWLEEFPSSEQIWVKQLIEKTLHKMIKPTVRNVRTRRLDLNGWALVIRRTRSELGGLLARMICTSSGRPILGRAAQYGNGNRLVKNADGSITTSTFDGADQLIDSVDSTGTTSYSFDDNGNLSLAVSPTGERTTRTWGYENQVELVRLPNGQLVTASYNADNRRVQKLT